MITVTAMMVDVLVVIDAWSGLASLSLNCLPLVLSISFILNKMSLFGSSFLSLYI